MANLFPDITPGVTTGSTAATVLNALGRSDESAIKIVSGSSVLTTESGYYKEGTLVFSKNEKKIYELSSGSFIDSGSTIAPSNKIFSTGDIRQVELYRSTLSGSGNFDVSSISQAYDHLVIYLVARSSVEAENDRIRIFLNNDTTATNYRYVTLNTKTGAAAARGSGDEPDLYYVPAATSTDDNGYLNIVDIPLYASDKRKQIFSRMGMSNLTYEWVAITTVGWESTAAINRITIQPDGYPTDAFAIGSFLQIIGVKTV